MIRSQWEEGKADFRTTTSFLAGSWKGPVKIHKKGPGAGGKDQHPIGIGLQFLNK